MNYTKSFGKFLDEFDSNQIRQCNNDFGNFEAKTFQKP